MRKIGITSMILGVICMCLAIVLLAYNRLQSNAEEESSNKALENLKETIDKGSDTEEDAEGYIGYLTIEALDLELPVKGSWDYAQLEISPCRYYGSIENNDLVICAHNSNAHFGRLKELNTGDQIVFTNIHDDVFVYEVKDIEILEPTDITEMLESEYDLTLYTCTYAGVARVTVRCDRIV